MGEKEKVGGRGERERVARRYGKLARLVRLVRCSVHTVS